MAGKTSAKNAALIVGGYSLPGMFDRYAVEGPMVEPINVTGFADQCENFIPGMTTAGLTLDGFWDSTTTTGLNTALSGLGAKCVTIIPEGYTLGAVSLSLYGEQLHWNPVGNPSDAVRVQGVDFVSKGTAGIDMGWALAHATITDTTTGTGYDDPSGGAVTAACAGYLHVWTPCAADTYVVKIQHATTLGGAYSDLVTFTLNGSARSSERVAVASGTINRFRRVLATRTGAAGNPFGFTVTFWHA